MASAEISEDETCSTCLYLCSSSATLRCGHSVCEDCLKNVNSTQENEQCNECRTKRRQEVEVLCTYCMQLPVPAVKTCLMCEASLCQKHLSVHKKSPEHVLIEPTVSCSRQKCTIHRELLKYYCSVDDSVICTSCYLIGDHKGHDVELLHDASEKKKEKLKTLLKKRKSRREKTRGKIKDLEEEMSRVKDKAETIKGQVSTLFTDIRSQLEALEIRVLREVSRQEQQVVSSLSELVQELEMKVEKLSKQISNTEERCRVTDPLTVLTRRSSTPDTLANGCGRKLSDESVYQVESLDEVLISMTLHRNLANIVNTVNAAQEFQVLEASEILLDENTAGDYVFVSGDLKTAGNSSVNLRRPETPERFYCNQVLSSKSFPSGRHSWEVEASNWGDWMIGVAYSTIERKGSLSFLGINDQSWCLQRCKNKYSMKHNSETIRIDVEHSCQRYLIYLDYEAGQLSFYQLSDPICLLHTYKNTFKAPLHAAFWVEDEAWVKIRS